MVIFRHLKLKEKLRFFGNLKMLFIILLLIEKHKHYKYNKSKNYRQNICLNLI